MLTALSGMVALNACGMNLSLSAEAGDAEDTGSSPDVPGTAAATGGTGGTDAQSLIEIYPDDSDADPSKPYGNLCGQGACVIGEMASCDGEFDACQLVQGSTTAVAACGSTGKSLADGPCTSVSDCAPGLGCVKETSSGGLCKPYCCGDAELCPANTYCAPQPMAEAIDNGSRQLIPVCITATPCDPFKEKSACKDGLACTIVRADGLLSCVTPGPHGLNEPCPCAAGFVCSKLTDECKKLCRIGQDDVDCGGGATCQGASLGYPSNIGICVGGAGF